APDVSADVAQAVAIDPNTGAIYVAGFTTLNPTDFGGNTNFAVARILPNGTLDTSFGGGDGLVAVDFGGVELGDDLAIHSDGKIVIVGEATSTTQTDAAVVRLNTDGTLDTTFNDVATPTPANGDGRLSFSFVTTPADQFDTAAGVAVQSDGKIV